MTASGSQVAISGKMQSRTICNIINNTKGKDPFNIFPIDISGAIPCITNKLSPTGGVIRPISILMVMITPNQIGSKPAAVIIGYNIGAVISMIATGGKKHPAINKNILI
jgi:hypothetical protein